VPGLRRRERSARDRSPRASLSRCFAVLESSPPTGLALLGSDLEPNGPLDVHSVSRLEILGLLGRQRGEKFYAQHTNELEIIFRGNEDGAEAGAPTCLSIPFTPSLHPMRSR
jgi:hypothetical protein